MLAAGVLVFIALGGSLAQEVTVANLLVEHRPAPVGIDSRAPRFSWQLRGGANGMRQTAYQIEVSTETAEKSKVWESGWVQSDQSHLVPYAGKPLLSSTPYVWRVRVRNEKGVESAWSETARWVTGLLDAPKELRADWIGWDRPSPITPHGEDWFAINEAAWICHPALPKGKDSIAYYRSTFEIPADATLVMIGMEANFTGQLFLNGIELFQGGRFVAVPSYLDVTPWIKPGPNVLAFRINESQHQEHSGLIASVRIEQPGGKISRHFTDGTWQATLKPVNLWAGGTKADDGWQPVAVLGKPGDPNKTGQGKPTLFEPKFGSEVFMPPAIYLRREINLKKPVRFAVFHGTAQGLYDLRINGRKMTPTGLQPGWTQFDRHLDYVSTDVTAALQPGRNALGVVVADGWFRGNLIWQGRENFAKVFGDKLRFSGQLEVEYLDGSRETFRTDPAWKATHGSNLQSDIYFGEIHDARLETGGWDKPNFADQGWSPVTAVPRPDEEDFIQSAHPTETVRAEQELAPQAITEPHPGVYVFDFGQNFAGWTRLKTIGRDAQVVYIRFGEVLNPDGTIYTENLRGANPADRYVCKGGGLETWEPSFTYHGFRYAQVVGLTEKPTKETLTGIVAHSGGPITSTFESSSPMLNRLYQNIQWSQRSNYFETMTDCPQRDERLGWTGDAHFFMPTSAYNQNLASFYTKWFRDCVDTQNTNGNISNGAPGWRPGPGNGPIDWSAAMMVTPWMIWQRYGDEQPIKENYAALRRYMTQWEKFAKLVNKPTDGRPDYKLNGDWLALEKTPKEFVGRVLGYVLSQYMVDFARLTGNEDDVRTFSELASHFRDEIIAKHIAPDGTVASDSETAYASVCLYQLYPENLKTLIRDKFQKRMAANNFTVTTGFNGTGKLLPGLTAAGLTSEAGKTLLNEEAPGWGNMVKLGATTIWEHWDSQNPDGTFANPTMNSFNHYTFGGCGEWIMGHLVGLRAEAPGFKVVLVEPTIVPGLDWVKGSFETPYGTVSNSWERKNGKITMRLVVPPNSSAKVILPPGAKLLAPYGKSKVCPPTVESGSHEFVWAE